MSFEGIENSSDTGIEDSDQGIQDNRNEIAGKDPETHDIEGISPEAKLAISGQPPTSEERPSMSDLLSKDTIQGIQGIISPEEERK